MVVDVFSLFLKGSPPLTDSRRWWLRFLIGMEGGKCIAIVVFLCLGEL